MDGLELVNAEIPFAFAGKEYRVKRANLSQVIQFPRKAKDVSGDGGGDLLLVAFAVFLILYAVDKNITEEFVLENCPGDIDAVEMLARLGFMSQQKMEVMRNARNVLATKA